MTFISKTDNAPEPEVSDLYGIAELATEFGITQRAIRFYEAKGLLIPPRVNGMRVYTKRERARLKLIMRAKIIGFSLSEIAQFLNLYGVQGEGKAQQASFIVERSAALIAKLEEKQIKITTTLEELQNIKIQCERYLAGEKSCEDKFAATSETPVKV